MALDIDREWNALRALGRLGGSGGTPGRFVRCGLFARRKAIASSTSWVTTFSIAGANSVKFSFVVELLPQLRRNPQTSSTSEHAALGQDARLSDALFWPENYCKGGAYQWPTTFGHAAGSIAMV